MKNSKGWFWIFVGPVLLAFIIVVIVPMITGIYYSFTDWNGIGNDANWVGLKNYTKIFTEDKDFLNAFLFTAKFALVSLITINVIGFGLALLMTKGLKLTNFFRSIFFMPNMIGGLILGFVWQFIFTKGFDSLGKLLNWSFLRGWLADPTTGFWGLVILMSWQMSGYMMVIYIAAIENIPESSLEAAKIDGANAWQRLRYIIMPLVAPAFTVGLFLTLSNSFKLYDQNLSLTAGGPHNSTQMLAMNIYNTAFKFNKLGLAQAKAVIFLITVAVITLTQIYYSKRREVEM
ncbi:sugar ABC transporter permease [Anaerosalibacter bizertensis]|uniref:carbohydrate ABC transporter permease n=1 Tax=Anaerosalibacter bizertensis TaxID=932217 RepID=UPI001C0EF528|nr:sugar ABC transporter permease [Anaerosalibacter bizertensis]MBU5294610.1 sugar ABC transporter permease [Anaerosalibacter bizertensis]MCB5559194.1 sugar ABC transporter permease [Anaerosalibacter bizertensis]MCG4584418.1 sugar ABC transporter permease [Anaerosalibacter bizertensis]